jgi:kexin
VEPVWAADRKGESVLVAIVDDGLEIGHPDLQENVLPNQSHNYLNGTKNPTPTDPEDGHGTSVGGVVAARDFNGIGGRGAAPRANLVGYNLIASGGNTSANEADAMTRNAASVHVSNNSWGATDNRGNLAASSAGWQTAINTGVTTGRNGKGIIYTWSAGNGAPRDNSNYDGRANYHGVLSICATSAAGKKASYSEPGANNWVCASSGTFDVELPAITTTDLTGAPGENNTAPNCPDWITPLTDLNYTSCFTGTSSAAPLAAGVIALILQANPNLTWRDLRLILAETARKNDSTDSDWRNVGMNSVGGPYHHNHKYGFGVIDAQAAVQRALLWANVGPELSGGTQVITVNQPIPDNNTTGISSTLNVTSGPFMKIEWVDVFFSAANHTYDGDLQVELTNVGTGTTSRLADLHACNPDPLCRSGGYDNWRFGTARHLGENPIGQWRLTVRDLAAQDTGTFQSWRLVFYGRN